MQEAISTTSESREYHRADCWSYRESMAPGYNTSKHDVWVHIFTN